MFNKFSFFLNKQYKYFPDKTDYSVVFTEKSVENSLTDQISNSFTDSGLESKSLIFHFDEQKFQKTFDCPLAHGLHNRSLILPFFCALRFSSVYG